MSMVQKNRIKSLAIVHTLGEDKSKVLDVISDGFNFLTQGWPKIYLIPPNDPSLLFGSFINNPYNNIFIYKDSST